MLQFFSFSRQYLQPLLDKNRAACSNATLIGGVTEIGVGAFYACKLLTSITIPDSVTRIGHFAFCDCDNLTMIMMGNGVGSIGKYAFRCCSKLTGGYIHDVMAWCNIDFADSTSNPLYYAHNLYLNNQPLTDLVIPDGIKYIHSYAFHCVRNLTRVTIPDSVTRIGESAFSRCKNLTRVTMGNGVTDIRASFYWCWNLEGVYITDLAAWCKINFSDPTSNPLCYAHNLYLNNKLVSELIIPDEIERIKDFAFYGGKGFSVAIPNSVTSIGEKAFQNGCLSQYNKYDNAYYLGNADNPYRFLVKARSKTIKTCKIHQDCKIISDCAFNGCNNLTDIAIPDSVMHIGFSAFRNCGTLVGITVDEGNSVYKAMHGVLYSKDGERLVLYPQDHSDKSFVIPQEVRLTEGYSFWRCKNLEEISILGKNFRFSDRCGLAYNDRVRKVILYISDAEVLSYFKWKHHIVLDLRALPFTVIKANIMKESSMFCYMENCINGIEYPEDVVKENDAYIKRIRGKLYKDARVRSWVMRYMTSKKIFDLQDALTILGADTERMSSESEELLMEYLPYLLAAKTMTLGRAMKILENTTEQTSVVVKAYLMDYIHSFDETERQEYMKKQEKKMEKEFSLE